MNAGEIRSIGLTFTVTAILYYIHVHTSGTNKLLHLFGRKTAMTDTIVFSIVHVFVFYFIHKYVPPIIENMGNYGPTCPNGYTMQADQSCKPIGHATYEGKNY